MALISAGTSLKITDGSHEHSVGGLTKIGGFAMSAGEYETTTLGSSGGFRTFGQGLKDAGELVAEGFFNPSDTDGQMALKDAFEDGSETEFAIEFPSGARFEFGGFVKSWCIGAITPDGLQTFKVGLRISGKPIFVES